MTTEAYKTAADGVALHVAKLDQTMSRQRRADYISTAGDSVWIPVTYYDYRADMSNPEFQVHQSNGQNVELRGMVEDTLDSDRKPIPTKCNISAFRTCILGCYLSNWYTTTATARLALFWATGWNFPKSWTTIPACRDNCLTTILGYPSNTCGWWFSDSLRKWFRPDRAPGATFDTVTGTWTNLVNRRRVGGAIIPDEWVGTAYDSTKPFANIVIYDSLLFREDPDQPGVWVFGDSITASTRDTQFFVFNCASASSKNPYKFMPLKNRGFKADALSKRYGSSGPCPYCGSDFSKTTCDSLKENFAFTMELHRKFVYKEGQTFTFEGDDDVWVFINNRLVIDLGGIHMERRKNVALDALGLSPGNEYWFDLFYCDRHTNESNIFINTNMLMFVPPQRQKRSWRRDYGNLD
ncbi:MAG: fibro-slime domain-containing protein, partial [Chitinispirillaceae bacterium]|nr:fibro-slime domain-containing protein [Chitinispirillaceae bacterium]